ncbi:unnamed protein product [Prorocentrum cordatum]|uniref:Uncharacterized protein n=1 Tax=Prorocentrum cordatum TaxID=2364126 RepID=A0ABN9VKP8_9DINO|nr:unnamed protein product [Polarella glacialis]
MPTGTSRHTKVETVTSMGSQKHVGHLQALADHAVHLQVVDDDGAHLQVLEHFEVLDHHRDLNRTQVHDRVRVLHGKHLGAPADDIGIDLHREQGDVGPSASHPG